MENGTIDPATGGVKQVLEFIGDYGVSLVITAIVVFALILTLVLAYKYISGVIERKRKKDEYTLQAEQRLEDHKRIQEEEQREHLRLLAIRDDISLKVQVTIEKLLTQCNADRVTVMEFHNGSESVTGIPFKKMSCTYEAYRLGLLPIGQLMGERQNSLYTLFLSNLQKLPYVILDVEHRDTSLATSAYEFLVQQDVAKALCVMLTTLNKQHIGYVTLKKDDDFTSDDIDAIEDVAQQLSLLLSLSSVKDVRGEVTPDENLHKT